MSQYWIEFDVPSNAEWEKRTSVVNFGGIELPCTELFEEMIPFGIDVFFDDEDDVKTADKYSLRVKAAKAACARCPVQEHCLEYALVSGIPYGIWGGATTRERTEIKRRLGNYRASKGN